MPTPAEQTPAVLREAHALYPPAGTNAVRSVGPLLLAVVAAALMQWAIGPALGLYATRMLLDAGIAIVLAVSLNIVNGLAGQFSLGHAGFLESNTAIHPVSYTAAEAGQQGTLRR